jgi:DDE superfamily endonuclease
MRAALRRLHNAITAGRYVARKFMVKEAETEGHALVLSQEKGVSRCLHQYCLMAALMPNLFPELEPESTLIMDNAAFHKKKQVAEIAQIYGQYVLFLPPYSPDFNPIEQDFANIKKIRAYANPEKTLDEIIKSYGS